MGFEGLGFGSCYKGCERVLCGINTSLGPQQWQAHIPCPAIHYTIPHHHVISIHCTCNIHLGFEGVGIRGLEFRDHTCILYYTLQSMHPHIH